MDVLKPSPNSGHYPILFLFGRGLIGGAFREFIIKTGCYSCTSHPSDWQNWEKTAEIFKQEIKKIPLRESSRVEIVWCAGKATFGSSHAETATELAFFENLATCLDRHLSCYDSGFTLISSAGAMFEGRRLVNNLTIEKPLRSYGLLKRKQEELIYGLLNLKRVRIFRLSSVYGHIFQGHRRGLITTLIWNGINGYITNITGDFRTLRDYIFADDVALYLGKKVLFSPQPDKRINFYTLTSGKPISILEAIRVVEFLLKKRALIRFDFSKSNAADITYSPRLSPPDWAPQNLIVGVKSIIREWQHR